jgi:hypothetical protein
MNSSSANYCPKCGRPVIDSTALHSDDALPAAVQGEFDGENPDGCVQASEREVAIYAHDTGGGEGGEP